MQEGTAEIAGPSHTTSETRTVTVGLIDGSAIVGTIGRFSPARADLAIASDQGARQLVAAERVAYVAYHKGQGPRPAPPPGAERHKIHLVGNSHMMVMAALSTQAEGLGFKAVAADSDSAFHEIFFYHHGVLAKEKDEPIGELLVKQGSIAPGDLARGVGAQNAERAIPIGQILVEQRKIAPDDAARAAKEQQRRILWGFSPIWGPLLLLRILFSPLLCLSPRRSGILAACAARAPGKSRIARRSRCTAAGACVRRSCTRGRMCTLCAMARWRCRDARSATKPPQTLARFKGCRAAFAAAAAVAAAAAFAAASVFAASLRAKSSSFGAGAALAAASAADALLGCTAAGVEGEPATASGLPSDGLPAATMANNIMTLHELK